MNWRHIWGEGGGGGGEINAPRCLLLRKLVLNVVTFPPQRLIRDIRESLGGEQFSDTNISGHFTKSSWQ